MSTLRLVIASDKVRILRRTVFAALMYGSVAAGGILFGLFFIYGLQDSGVPTIIRYAGYLMAGGCTLMLLFLPKYLRRLSRHGGDLIFEADREGIRMVPDRLQGTTLWGSPLSVVRVGWQDVRGMVCAEWFEQRFVSREAVHGRMIIFVEPHAVSAMEALYKFSDRAPDGRTVILTPFSADHFSRFRPAIEHLSQGKVVPGMHERVVFDYRKKEVRFGHPRQCIRRKGGMGDFLGGEDDKQVVLERKREWSAGRQEFMSNREGGISGRCGTSFEAARGHVQRGGWGDLATDRTGRGKNRALG